jgi:hypothetical protein
MMKSYNAAPPTTVRTPLWAVVELGWEHTVEGDGDDAEVVLTLDDDNNPVPKTYRFPTRVTAAQITEAFKAVTPDTLAVINGGGMESVVETVGAVLGRDLVLGIAADPTVDADAFIEWATDTVLGWGLSGAVPDGPGN